jgi:hypothetical protein
MGSVLISGNLKDKLKGQKVGREGLGNTEVFNSFQKQCRGVEEC